MATIMSQLNLKMIGLKHDKVLAYPSCCTRQVTSSVNFPKSFNHNIYHNSWLLSIANLRTSSSSNKNYCYYNDADPFAAENIMMMKPSVGKSSSTRNFVDTISRILASLLTYGAVFTFLTVAACLYASNSALAASHGRISGSGSSSSSYSSSYDSALSYYRNGYMSNDEEEDESSVTDTCTCDTSCSDCSDCEVRENGYKVEEEEEEDSNSSTNSSCSCNCHSTCYFHKKRDFLYENILGCIILATIAFVIISEWQRVNAQFSGLVKSLVCNL